MKLYWMGPTMGKTTACKKFSNIIDFDDIIREPAKKLAEQLNLTVKEMKKKMPKEYCDLFLNLLNELENINDDKHVLVSNAIGLKHYYYKFEVLMIPSVDEFLKRNVARGGDAQESWDLYQDLMHVHGAQKKCVIENKFVTELISDGFFKY